MKTFIEWTGDRRRFLGQVGSAFGSLAITTMIPSILYGTENQIWPYTDEQTIGLSKKISSEQLRSIGVTERDVDNYKPLAKKKLFQRDMRDPKFAQQHKQWKEKYLVKEKSRLQKMWDGIKKDDQLTDSQKAEWSGEIKKMWQVAQEYSESPDLGVIVSDNRIQLKRFDAVVALALLMAYIKKGGKLQ